SEERVGIRLARARARSLSSTRKKDGWWANGRWKSSGHEGKGASQTGAARAYRFEVLAEKNQSCIGSRGAPAEFAASRCAFGQRLHWFGGNDHAVVGYASAAQGSVEAGGSAERWNAAVLNRVHELCLPSLSCRVVDSSREPRLLQGDAQRGLRGLRGFGVRRARFGQTLPAGHRRLNRPSRVSRSQARST